MMKFIASDIDAAKKKARRALGDKTVVVSVRNLPSGDIELTASDKNEPNAPQPAPKSEYASAAREAVQPGPFKPSAGIRLNEAVEQRFSEQALARLSGRLTGGKARKLDMSDATVRSMADKLAPHGLGETLIAALVAGARSSPIDEDLYRLKTGFEETFSFSPLRLSPSSPIMLIGPTGAGKTSCAAKLAASVRDEGEPAFMMTADVGRAGAIEQIKSYSQSLGADYFIIESPLDVSQALRNHRPRGAVLLDTPGVSPYDGGDLAALASYRDEAGAEPVLVLPAGGDASEYLDWVDAFKEIGVRRLIITKFDASKRVGAALNAAFAGEIALAHFSQTAFISDGLIDANADYLSRRLIAGSPGRVE